MWRNFCVFLVILGVGCGNDRTVDVDLERQNAALGASLKACEEARAEEPSCPGCPEQEVKCVCETPPPPVQPVPYRYPKNVRMVVISVDGFHTALVENMPGFKKMLKYGVWSLRAKTTVPSITTVAHASMFTGLYPEKHGVKSGAPKGAVELAHWRPLKVRTVFQFMDKELVKPLALIQKKKLENLLPASAFTEVMLDRSNTEKRIVDRACQEFKDVQGSRMVFIHLKRLDSIGHKHGWLSKEQRVAATHIDTALKQLSACIAEGQSIHQAEFALIITSDHGGHGKTHGSARPSDVEIPWLLIGPEVKKGFLADDKSRPDIRVKVEDTAAWIRHYLHETLVGDYPRNIDGGFWAHFSSY